MELSLADGLTQHLADIGFDVDVLEVLEGVSVEQSEGGVQSDRHPDAIAMPGQLTDLAVLTRVGIKGLLQFEQHTHTHTQKNVWKMIEDLEALMTVLKNHLIITKFRIITVGNCLKTQM